MGKRGETTGPTGGLEGEPEPRGGGGQAASEGEGVIADKRGGTEGRDTTGGGRFARKNHIVRVINEQMEGRIRQQDLFVGSGEVGVGMETAVHPDRLEAHGQAGNVKPAMFLDNVITKKEADGAAAGNGHCLAVGSGDEGVLDRAIVGEVGTARGHGKGSAGIDTQTGGRREGSSGDVRGAQELDGKGKDLRTKGVGRKERAARRAGRDTRRATRVTRHAGNITRRAREIARRGREVGRRGGRITRRAWKHRSTRGITKVKSTFIIRGSTTSSVR
jgi:hypothetical protein